VFPGQHTAQTRIAVLDVVVAWALHVVSRAVA
jgi:hypothetical protein